MVERVEYRASGPAATVAKRSAWIDSQVFGFSRAIRAFGVERFRKNTTQMVSGCGPSPGAECAGRDQSTLQVNGFNGVLAGLFGGAPVAAAAPMAHTLKEMRSAAAAAAAATDRAKANVLSSVHRT